MNCCCGSYLKCLLSCLPSARVTNRHPDENLLCMQAEREEPKSKQVPSSVKQTLCVLNLMWALRGNFTKYWHNAWALFIFLERTVLSACYPERKGQRYLFVSVSNNSVKRDYVKDPPCRISCDIAGGIQVFGFWPLQIPISGYYIHSTSQTFRT